MNNYTTVVENKPVPRNFWPKKVKAKHYVMGSSPLPQKVLMLNGHGWKQFRPVAETQYKNNLEPQSCPVGGTYNCIETLGLFQYKQLGFQSDLSERYGSIMMGMTGYGGWPWDAAEVIHGGAGAIPEAFLPFDSSITTLGKYFSPKPMTYSLFKIGAHWNKIYDFGWEWVFHPAQNISLAQKQNLMKFALQFSPIGIAGYAWSLHSDGKNYNDGPAIHWFDVDDYTEGDSWDAFDTYPTYEKKLDWNYDPAYCIRYHLGRKTGAENVVFDPALAPDCKLEYALYIIKWFLSNFTQK